MSLGHQHEIEQSNRILELLRDKDVRIIGETSAAQNQRAPTIAFSPNKAKAEVIAQTLSKQQIGVGASHFYAFRLMQAMGIDPDEGVVRISLVHYTSVDDVDRLLTALDDHL
jgi:selenocysteine lyase/cysteine desulfurase